MRPCFQDIVVVVGKQDLVGVFMLYLNDYRAVASFC